MSAKKAYSPYGYHLPGQDALGFNGEQLDSLTGHYHLGKGYRSYTPVLMRFLSADNLSPFAQGGLNAYAYCLGDPVNNQDPSGHGVWDRLLRRAPVVIKKPTFSRVFGYHATDGWNVSSLLGGLKRGHSLEGRRSLNEGVYFGRTRGKVKPYQEQAIDGVILTGMVQDGVSLVPGLGFEADPGGVIVIKPAAYEVIQMVKEAPPGAAFLDLPLTGIFATQKTTSSQSAGKGAEAPSVEKAKIRGK